MPGRENPRTPTPGLVSGGSVAAGPDRTRGNRYPAPGRTAQALREHSEGIFSHRRGKSAPVGDRTPHLWGAAGCFAPLGLTTLGEISETWHTVTI